MTSSADARAASGGGGGGAEERRQDAAGVVGADVGVGVGVVREERAARQAEAGCVEQTAAEQQATAEEATAAAAAAAAAAAVVQAEVQEEVEYITPEWHGVVTTNPKTGSKQWEMVVSGGARMLIAFVGVRVRVGVGVGLGLGLGLGLGHLRHVAVVAFEPPIVAHSIHDPVSSTLSSPAPTSQGEG